MSKKTELLQEVRKFKTDYELMEKKIHEMRQSGSYTQIGIETEIKNLLDTLTASVQGTHDRMIQIIDTGLEALENRWKAAATGKLMDGGYQAGLSNVLKVIEIGALTEQSDIQNIIDTYRGDFNALAAIKKMIANNPEEKIRFADILIPKDIRGDTRRLIGQLRRNIDTTVNPYTAEAALKCQEPGFSSLTLSLGGMETFVNDRLGDNLEVWA